MGFRCLSSLLPSPAAFYDETCNAPASAASDGGNAIFLGQRRGRALMQGDQRGAFNPRPWVSRMGRDAEMRQRGMRGFSLLEMMAVIAITFVVAAYAVMTLQPDLQNTRVTNAYNTTLMALRQARDISIAQRQVYYVTFTHNTAPPDTITITNGGTGNAVSTYQLPLDLAFTVVTGIPTGAGLTPDGFGNGGTAIDFDQGVSGGTKNVLYFYPDGSAQDVNGNINNGVLYIARPGVLFSSRAITVWGATGRLRGWRLYTNNNTTYWRQM